jgi:small subunit ribosomal protein S4e
MTRHGGSRSLKRLNTPKFLQIKRKHGKFFMKPSSGPHPSRFCLPLLHIVRDLLKLVDNHREAKKLIGLGNFKVDGKVVKDTTYPVGLMDVLSIDRINKHYRILPDSHYGLILHEITEAESTFKLCRITQKTTIKGGHIQLNLHDGKKNIGQLGKVINILKRFGPKASTVSIQHNSEHTETLYDYTFIIGEDQSEISLPKTE